MAKLSFVRKADSVISIDLHNNYSVIATVSYSFEEQEYKVALYLKHNGLDIIQSMDDFENIEFATTSKTVYAAVLKSVATLLSERKFDSYIRRYEYLLECFERGNAKIERERLNNVD